jgi:hypothetical protein
MKHKYLKAVIEPINEVEFVDQASKKRLAEVYTDLLQLLAQVCDEAASGDNVWLSMGATKEKSALVVTVHTPEGNMSVYGATLGGLCLEAKSLL